MVCLNSWTCMKCGEKVHHDEMKDHVCGVKNCRCCGQPLPEPTPQLHNGFSPEQWERIAELSKIVPIVCEFTQHGKSPEYGILAEVLEYNHPFPFGIKQPGGAAPVFANGCRIITKPGYWQPWFGGECPVEDESVPILVCFENGYCLGNKRGWTDDVIAYMVMPSSIPGQSGKP